MVMPERSWDEAFTVFQEGIAHVDILTEEVRELKVNNDRLEANTVALKEQQETTKTHRKWLWIAYVALVVVFGLVVGGFAYFYTQDRDDDRRFRESIAALIETTCKVRNTNTRTNTTLWHSILDYIDPLSDTNDAVVENLRNIVRGGTRYADCTHNGVIGDEDFIPDDPTVSTGP